MSQSLRYNSLAHVRAFREGRRWPEIHRPMVEAVLELARGQAVLDLCCSTGLLGERLASLGFQAVGVERDVEAIAAARARGVTVPIVPMSVEPATLETLTRLIAERQVTVLVARRCFSEIFAARMDWAAVFCRRVADAGIRELFLQGRVFSTRSRHPIPHTDAEVALCRGVFTQRIRRGPVAYLTLEE
ncbi:MAG: hypothetical protein JW809_19385 [Pirellulales bacterium]|nr:hypothetical protein [Pirellulales bacterium]